MNLFKMFDVIMPRSMKNEKGIAPLVAAALISAAGSVAGSAMSTFGGKKGDSGITRLEEFPEAEEARKMWWEKLQGWGNDPNYGAISPDWESIWQQAMDKVNAYYQGTPTGTGMFDKVKSSFAARNTSDSPAMTRSIARLGAEQAGQIKDLGRSQSIAKAEFGEQGRLNWLKSLMGLTQVKPSYMGGGAQTQSSSGIGSAITGITGAIGSAMTKSALQKNQQDWISGLLQGNQNTGPTSFDNLGTDIEKYFM